ncbi:hypothetical protein AMJ44_06485 [candidate division WOR-1 bacterium DG_54_3]|uniref:Uncharacterized protein n=1 Tax=candidate division WOR-1 bacterium DG_54_3 TaxID=1703775 RepID=A0A0S7Y158_UNCSA|nr:MAG: hypothetical protein AMJ44_06485 [candidate division WOR-1 bacterium DG_54_3]
MGIEANIAESRLNIPRERFEQIRRVANRKANPHDGMLHTSVQTAKRGASKAAVKLISFLDNPKKVKDAETRPDLKINSGTNKQLYELKKGTTLLALNVMLGALVPGSKALITKIANLGVYNVR